MNCINSYRVVNVYSQKKEKLDSEFNKTRNNNWKRRYNSREVDFSKNVLAANDPVNPKGVTTDTWLAAIALFPAMILKFFC